MSSGAGSRYVFDSSTLHTFPEDSWSCLQKRFRPAPALKWYRPRHGPPSLIVPPMVATIDTQLTVEMSSSSLGVKASSSSLAPVKASSSSSSVLTGPPPPPPPLPRVKTTSPTLPPQVRTPGPVKEASTGLFGLSIVSTISEAETEAETASPASKVESTQSHLAEIGYNYNHKIMRVPVKPNTPRAVAKMRNKVSLADCSVDSPSPSVAVGTSRLRFEICTEDGDSAATYEI